MSEGKSISTKYNDPAKWAAERHAQQQSAAKEKKVFSTTISAK